MNIKAEIQNGRLIIESNTNKGSDLLSKWIDENKHSINRASCNIEILAHDEHFFKLEKVEELEFMLNELHNDLAKSIIDCKIYKPLSTDLLLIKDKIRLLKDNFNNLT